MKSSTLWTIVIVLVVVLGGWYLFSKGQSSNSTYSSPSSPQEPTSSQPTATTSGSTTSPASESLVTVESSATLGRYLVASNGMTLYRSSADVNGKSNCTSALCVGNWPPYTVPAGITLSVNATLTGTLGTLVRADGTTQLTYRGMPLYFWVGDKKPGDVKGNGVKTFTLVRP